MDGEKYVSQTSMFDEVKEIRAKAKAPETYAKQALNTEAERKCGQIRLRAQRRPGNCFGG